jgi:hypothetical protein
VLVEDDGGGRQCIINCDIAQCLNDEFNVHIPWKIFIKVYA